MRPSLRLLKIRRCLAILRDGILSVRQGRFGCLAFSDAGGEREWSAERKQKAVMNAYLIEHPLNDSLRHAEITRTHALVQALDALVRQNILGHNKRRQYPTFWLHPCHRWRNHTRSRPGRLLIRQNPFLMLGLELQPRLDHPYRIRCGRCYDTSECRSNKMNDGAGFCGTDGGGG